MCHRKLSVDFCPNVNFIHGQNGSGKSAILVALQICLGARASVTHRGSKMTDLIRQGHDGFALVRVTMLNRGADAFEHDKYGDYITVERKIERSGKLEYRLMKGDPNKPESLQLVSKKRDDLSRMLDLLNIQIDNPCALLDQENSKKFIQGGEGEKYKFFERATDIDRVQRSLSEGKKMAKEARDKLEMAKEDLPEMLKVFQDLQKQLDDMQGVAQIEADLNNKRIELQWRLHMDKEEETATALENVEKMAQRLEQARNKLRKAEEDKEGKQANVAEFEASLQGLRDQIADAKSKIGDIKRQIAVRKKPILTLEAQSKGKAEDIKSYLRKKKEAQRQMEEEQARLEKQAAAEVGEKVAKVKAIDVKLEEMEGTRKEKEARVVEMRGEKEGVLGQLQTVRGNLRNAQRSVAAIQSQMRALEGASSNQVAVYGDVYVRVCAEIQKNARRFQQLPIGPLGMYVKVKKGAEEWAGVCENALGPAIQNFIVTSHQDRKVLQDILKNQRASFISVYTSSPHRRYVVPARSANVRLVTECVSIENDLVYNTLVDWAKIDSAALVRNRHEAEQLAGGGGGGMKRFPPGIKTVYDMDDYQTELKGGAMIYRPCTKNMHRGRVLGKDTTTMRVALERELGGAQGGLREMEGEVRGCEGRLKALEGEEKGLKREMARVEGRVRELREEKVELNEAIRDEQEAKEARVNFAELQATIDTYDEQIRELQEAQEKVKEEKARLEEEIKPLQAQEANETKRNQTLQKKLDHETSKIDDKVAEIDGVDAAIRKAKKGLRKGEDAEKELQKALKEARDAEAHNLALLEEFTRGAKPGWDGEKIEPTVEAKAIETDIKRLRGKLERKQREQRTMDSVEVVTAKYERARTALRRKERDIESVEVNLERLEKGFELRKTKLRVLRKAIARAANRAFDGIQQHKGQSGGLKFDFQNRELIIGLQKDNRDASTLSTNVRELSGGERSYTTLALLIALGEAIECPFRVMDEFDIFMDAVSRKTALDLLVSYATSSSMQHRQFIFITPQDLSYVQSRVSNNFRIHKLLPPERNAGTLQQQTL